MTDTISPEFQPRRSRRRLVLEGAGAAVLLAIPAGAVIATAQPIVNPPGREELDVLSEQRKEVLEQRAATDKDADEPSSWEKAREERKKARKARERQSTAKESNDS